MSTALTTALYRRLAGVEDLSATPDAATAQAALAALLGTDPDTSRPAVQLGNMATASTSGDAPVYPCVTFRPEGGVDDKRFAQQTGVVESAAFAVEIWNSSASSVTITDIDEQMEQLLDMRRGVAPALTVSGESVLWMEAEGPLSLLYDQRINAWAGLRRFRVVHCRY